MKKQALLIGINRYQDEGISRLLCAESDAVALEFYLRELCGFAVTRLVNELATKQRITNLVRELCTGLAPGDVFLLYFSGHGSDDPLTGQQVLLPWDLVLADIEQHLQPAVVPVRGIEAATARCGAARFLILDACRTPLRAGTKDAQTQLESAAARDIQTMVTEEARENPPLVTVCSCSPGQRAHEIETLGRGVFSKAFEEVLKAHVQAGRELSLPGSVQEELAGRTAQLLRSHGRSGRQDPLVSANRGRVVLIGGGSERRLPIAKVLDELEDAQHRELRSVLDELEQLQAAHHGG